MAFVIRYADLNLDFGAGGGDGLDRVASPWSFDLALTNAPGDCVVFTKAKDSDGTFVATSGMDVGNSNTLGTNQYTKFVAYKEWDDSYLTTLVTDMDPGGAYYGGVLDAYRGENSFSMSNANALWGKVSGGGTLADDLITIDGKDNIEFRGFKLFSNDGLTTNYIIQLLNEPEGLSFKNCKFDSGFSTIQGLASTALVDDCYFGENNGAGPGNFHPGFNSAVITRCVFKIPVNKYGLLTRLGMCVDNCVFIGGQYGIQLFDDTGAIHNCTFYNQTGAGILISANTGLLNEYNNIFNPAAINDNAVWLTTGQSIYSNYSLAWSLAGKMTASGTQWPWEFNAVGGNVSFAGPHVITDVDPDLNITDFRSSRMLLGRPDLRGLRRQIGAVLYTEAGRKPTPHWHGA